MFDDEINDVPAFTPGEPAMYVEGASLDLVDRPASFIAVAGQSIHGQWRVRIRLEDGTERQVNARRLYRRTSVGGPRAGGHESVSMANDTSTVTPPVIPHSTRNGNASDQLRAAE